MKPRHRAAGEAPFSADPETDRDSSSDSFRVDGRIGHAWFARSDRTKLPVQRGPQMLPALRKAELILAGQGRAIARRATRIPADAVVRMGAALAPPPSRLRAEIFGGTSTSNVANDNVGYLSQRTRTIMREVFFLVVFGATLAGTYYLGRLHAFHNVIVVPDPATRGTRVV